MKIAILIATYNEAENIGPLLEGIFQAIETTAHSAVAVIVDDDSPDGTGRILEELKAAKYGDQLHILHRKNERGCGSARRLGYKYILNLPVDYIIGMDADGSHDPRELPLFIEMGRFFDVVLGSRYVAGALVTGLTWDRKLVSAFANGIYRLILGTRIRDLSGGYHGFRRKVIESLPLDEFICSGYANGIETIFRCHKLGFTFLEIPILFENRKLGQSKFSTKEVKQAFKTIFTLIFRYGRASRTAELEKRLHNTSQKSPVASSQQV